MLHRLCGPPSIPLSFSLATVLPRRCTYRVSYDTNPAGLAPSARCLQLGLPGYLILFAPLAFAPQRQYPSRRSPSPLVFLPISTHFTATPGIPSSSPELNSRSISCTSRVKPGAFTTDLQERLRALYAQ